jgi:hypothetical protein
MNPLDSRKQLLIAESELNRAQLVHDWRTMAEGVRSLTDRVRSISSFATAAASLVAGFASFRRNKAAVADVGKPSWLQGILKSAGMLATFWQACRTPNQD